MCPVRERSNLSIIIDISKCIWLRLTHLGGLHQLVYHNKTRYVILLSLGQVSSPVYRDRVSDPKAFMGIGRGIILSWLSLQPLAMLTHVATLHIFPGVLFHFRP